MTSRVFRLDPKEIMDTWITLAPMFYKAISEHGSDAYTIQDLLKDFIDKESDCWVIKENGTIVAAVATYIKHYKHFSAIILDHFGGKEGYSHLWIPHLKQIENYAKECGIKRSEIHGRKAWERIFADDNEYQFRYITLIKGL